MSNQRGFSVVQVVLLIVLLGVVSATGWFVWQSKNKTNDTLANTARSGTEPQKTEKKAETIQQESDPTTDWVSYSNTKGVFKLKHPKTWVSASKPELCTDGLVLFGGNSASVGTCASDNGGQISISSVEGDQTEAYELSPDHYSDITKTVAVADGVQGTLIRGKAKGPGSDDVVEGYAAGTKVVQYLFFANNGRTYQALYVSATGYPDVLADFDTMVAKTLKFSL